MLINNFCVNFVTKCLNKIALTDNTYISMPDVDIDLLKSHGNSVTSKILEGMTFLFFCSINSANYMSCWLNATLRDSILVKAIGFVTVSGNLLCQLADHLLQFLVLKDLTVSYRPKYEQIFKRNCTFFDSNKFKRKINQIDWKTLFDIHDMNMF